MLVTITMVHVFPCDGCVIVNDDNNNYGISLVKIDYRQRPHGLTIDNYFIAYYQYQRRKCIKYLFNVHQCSIIIIIMKWIVCC